MRNGGSSAEASRSNAAAALAGSPWLFPIKIALEARRLAYRSIVLGTPFTKLRRRPCEVSPKTTGFNDGDLDTEWPNLFGQRLRKTFHAPLGGCIGRSPDWSNASCD